MNKENVLSMILLALLGLLSYSHSRELYGQASLRALPGVEVFVHCTGDPEIKRMENEIKNRLKSRLENAKVPMIAYNTLIDTNGEISNGGGALKFLITGFKKKEGDYFIYATLQLHQRAYLAVSHEYMDCPTWDKWKIGIFKENEIYLATEDMAREFVNDFISANSF